jgi:hypothetical protein
VRGSTAEQIHSYSIGPASRRGGDEVASELDRLRAATVRVDGSDSAYERWHESTQGAD